MKRFLDELAAALILAAGIGVPFALYFAFVMKP